MIPAKIQIGLMAYACDEPESIERKDDGAYLFGHVSHEEQTIDVRDALQPTLKAVALWHEIIHVILFQTGHFLDGADEERVCVAISHKLVEILRDNPELITYTLAAENEKLMPISQNGRDA